MSFSTSEYAEAAARVFAGETPLRENPLTQIGMALLAEFLAAEQQRRDAEMRWLMDLRQYRGIYEPEVEARLQGSRAFMRKTRVKVEAVDARMMDLLFPASRERNFSITATPEPSVPTPLRRRLERLLTELNQGEPPTAEMLKRAVHDAAAKAAGRMSVRIDDQLTEARYRDVVRKVMHSGHLYGTGILKGPLVERRTEVCYVWDETVQRFVHSHRSRIAPFIAHVPVWRWYPDMAVTVLEDARYVWEHHRLSRADMANMAERQTFDGAAIRSYIMANPDGAIQLRSYEQELRQMGEQKQLGMDHKTGQYDVFERWGWVEGEKLRDCGVEVEDARLHETFFANVWLLPDGQVIKAILAPIEGMRWPYYLYYLDKDETSIFGDGLATIMRGDQEMLNAAVRMLLDNAAVTAGPQFEVFVPAFPATANLTDIHPLKVWPRTGGDFQYPAVRALDFNSHISELTQLMQIFDSNADEVTAIPKFTYGDNPQNGAAATMGGLSMLLGQANISLKDMVVSFDEGITKPFISALYHWNMRFSTDDSIKGDFDVSARGAASLVAKEVRGQALAQFAATVQPEERGLIKWAELLKQRAEANDLTDVVLTEEEARAQAESPEAQQMQQMQQMQMQLEIAAKQAKLAEAEAKTAKAHAETMEIKINAIYAAMQAAGVAVQNPATAPAGDAILGSAGFQDQDATPDEGVSGAATQEGDAAGSPEGTQYPDTPEKAVPETISPDAPGPQESALQGARSGIQTAEVEA